MSGRPITEDDLHAFLDGHLDEARRAAVAAYLAAHPAVAARISQYGLQRGELRAAFDAVADEPVPSRLNLLHLAAPRSRPALAWRNLAAGLVLVIMSGAGGWFLHDWMLPPAKGVAALAREASDNYSVFANDRLHPVEMRIEDMESFVAWARAYLPRIPAIPDLALAGYRLMGGRIVATSHGPGVMLMYDDDRGTRLVLLSRPMAVDQNRRMMAHAQHGVEGWSWAIDGMGYSLVGAVPAERLHPLADDIRRQVAVHS